MSEQARKNLLYQLDKRVDKGLIKRVKHPSLDLLLYSYTNETQFHGQWCNYTKMARGLVVTTKGEYVARCPGKFFNYGERHCPDPPNLPYEMYEKVDGSFLSSWYYEGKWHIATRGSFDNQFIDYGRQFIPLYEHFPKHYTLFSEICLPSEIDGLDRCVKHDPGVYLLGAIDLYSGKDIHLSNLTENWKGYLPRVYKGDIESFVELAKTITETEGWVVRWSNGFRIKVKSAWYFRLFRSILRLDEKVRESIMQEVPFRDFLKDVPEELHGQAKEVYNHLLHYSKQEEYRLLGKVLDNWKPTKEAFVKGILTDPDKPLLINLYDEKPIKHILVENAPMPEKI